MILDSLCWVVSGLAVVDTNSLGLVVSGLDTVLTVVEIGMVEVITVVDSAGQLTTVGAQLVIVCSIVEYTMLVVISTGPVVEGPVSVAEVLAGVDTSSVVEGDSVKLDSVVGATSPVDVEVDSMDVISVVVGTSVVDGDSVEDDSVVATSAVEELDADTSETGHTVVEMAMVEVTTVVEAAGQFTTVGAQLVMVAMEVA